MVSEVGFASVAAESLVPKRATMTSGALLGRGTEPHRPTGKGTVGES